MSMALSPEEPLCTPGFRGAELPQGAVDFLPLLFRLGPISTVCGLGSGSTWGNIYFARIKETDLRT